MMTMERLEKLKILTGSDGKDARKKDYLNQCLMLLSEEANKAHNRNWFLLYEGGKNSKEWNKLEALLKKLNKKVQKGEEITHEDWENLEEAANAYQGKTEKKRTVADRVLAMCKRARDSNWPSKDEDDALLDIYKREKKGEFYALDYIADKSHYTHVMRLFLYWEEVRFNYKDCESLDLLVSGAKSAKNEWLLDPSSKAKKQAYTKTLELVCEQGKQLRKGDPKRARRLGGIAEAMGKLEPNTNDTSIVKHAKKMFPYAIGLALDLKAARSKRKNVTILRKDSKEYKKFLKATREYGKLIVNLITGREVVKDEAYNKAFNKLTTAAKAYLKHKFGKERANQIARDFPENLENAQDPEIKKVYKDADRKTKQKINLAIGALKNLTPLPKGPVSSIKNSNVI